MTATSPRKTTAAAAVRGRERRRSSRPTTGSSTKASTSAQTNGRTMSPARYTMYSPAIANSATTTRLVVLLQRAPMAAPGLSGRRGAELGSDRSLPRYLKWMQIEALNKVAKHRRQVVVEAHLG